MKPKKIPALDPERWQAFKLIHIEEISHDVKKFRFALPTPDAVLGLPIGQHISLKYVDAEGKEVQRSYTPVSSDDDLGIVEFVIKVYLKNVHPRFPDGGKMSQHMNGLRVGDSMLMKGPKGHLDYLGRGKFTITKRQVTTYRKKKIGMVAGGTGITPMLQVVRAILKDPLDRTEVWLMFGNQTQEDILLQKELEALPRDRFHLFYTLDRPPAGWAQGVGFVTAPMCAQNLPPAGEDAMIFMCGPPMMMQSIQAHLTQQGFADEAVFSF
ncbi:cytochrome b5 reductase 2 [Ochromonadaceae sp. CCMP2298]|nr:cytochrome b5 reductase 2 [Ochromonadaceae sp. CCMP2298]